MKYFSVAFFILLITFPFQSNAQTNSNNLVAKLNKLYRENVVLLKGKPEEIFINMGAKTVDIGNWKIPLDNYTANYEYSYNSFHKKKLHVAYLKCADGKNCMIEAETGIDYKAVGLFFKTKKACYDFINLIEQIKRSLE